jgi:hypothetical protein
MKNKTNNSRVLDDLKRRFIKEYRLPIPVIESDYWEYYLNLYDNSFDCKKLWDNLMTGLEKDYSGNINQFLEDFYNVRENMLTSIKNNISEYFLSKGGMPSKTADKNDPCSPYYDLPNKYKMVRKDSIYNSEFVGQYFLAIDLKKANVQALNWYDNSLFVGKPVDETTDIDTIYQEWLDKFKKGTYVDKYVKESKYIREVVFGNINPNRQIRIERYLVAKVLDYILPNLSKELKLVQIGSDEAVISVPKEFLSQINSENLIKEVRKQLGIDIKAELFKLEVKKFLSSSQKTISVFRKRPIASNSEKGMANEYKGISKLFYSQIYQWIYDIAPDPSDRDLVFYNEKELAKFLVRIVPLI